jgi:hypothetical protein
MRLARPTRGVRYFGLSYVAVAVFSFTCCSQAAASTLVAEFLFFAQYGQRQTSCRQEAPSLITAGEKSSDREFYDRANLRFVVSKSKELCFS